MRMQKRGQLAIIIIVAIVIVAAIVFYIIARESPKKINSLENIPQTNLNDKIALVSKYVRDCVSSTGFESALDNGRYGGYYVQPEQVNLDGIPYYYDKKTLARNLTPSLQEIENQISMGIKTTIGDCLADFADFPDYKVLPVNKKDMNITVKIESNQTIIHFHYPIYITHNNVTERVDDFGETYLDLRIGVVYNATEDIIKQFMEDPKTLCISCLKDLEYQYGVRVSAVKTGNSEIVYQVTDLFRSKGGVNFILRFAIKYA